MEANILVVDDEKEIADIVELYLKNEGFTVYKYYSARETLACTNAVAIDLALLDVMMPDMDGFTLCRLIRESHQFPILMLTAKDGEIDQITGLSLGADDYITKPFRPLELIARVKAQLRRYKKYNGGDRDTDSEIIQISGLTMNKSTHECVLNEKALKLTPTEFSILWLLCENRGRVVRSEQLFREVWGEQYYTKDNNTIMVHIRHIREKMGNSAEHSKYIKTVWGVGYKIE